MLGDPFALACNAAWSVRTFNRGDRLIANLSALVPLLALVLNQGPFAPPALPGFLTTTGPSATHRDPTSPSRVVG